MSKNDDLVSLYAVRDVVANQFGPVYHARNTAVAVRGYRKLISGGDVDKIDYELYCIGTYDMTTGDIRSHKPIKVEVPDSAMGDVVRDVVSKFGKNNVEVIK